MTGYLLDSEGAFTIALVCGYLALLVALVWRLPHCPCCARNVAKAHNRKHK